MLVTPDPCPECSPSTPDNLFAVTDNGTASDLVLILASVVATGILAASATVLVRRWRAATAPARRAIGAGALHRPRAARRAHRPLRDPGRRQLRPRRRRGRHPLDAGLRRAAVRVPRRPAAQPLVARRRGRRARRAPRRRARVADRDARRRDGRPDAAAGLLAARAGALRGRHRPHRRGPRRGRPGARGDDGRARRRARSARSSTTAALCDEPELVSAVAARRGARDGQRAPRGRAARPRSRSSASRAPGSSRPAWPSAGVSSATCTTAPSSGSSRCRCSSRRARQARRAIPSGAGALLDAAHATSCGSRSRSCASWRAASTRPCSPTAGWARRSRRSPAAAPAAGRGVVDAGSSGCPRPSRRPPTSSSPSR